MLLKTLTAAALLSCTLSSQATTINYAGTSTSVGNCFPFGCPDSMGAHMGFIYKNIGAFTLRAGDIIAFDTGLRNDKELRLDLSLAAATANGATTANASGFKLVSSLAPGVYGDNITGNYDIAFVVNTTFSFAGGGLIVDFVNANGAVLDTTSEQNLVRSIDNPYAVGRYYGSGGTELLAGAAGNFSITTGRAVPEPTPLALLALGMAALLVNRRRSKSA